MEDDTLLTCRNCGTEFLFTPGERAFYESKGFIDDRGRLILPTRCAPCRIARKRAQGFTDDVRW